jgi:peroxiredoxin
VGVSADHPATLQGFADANHIKHQLLGDFRRQMLPKYDALVTDESSPVFRYARRAYFVIDREGKVRFAKVMDNPLDLMQPDDVLKALKESGA